MALFRARFLISELIVAAERLFASVVMVRKAPVGGIAAKSGVDGAENRHVIAKLLREDEGVESRGKQRGREGFWQLLSARAKFHHVTLGGSRRGQGHVEVLLIHQYLIHHSSIQLTHLSY